MAKPVTTLAVFFVAMNFLVVAMAAQGIFGVVGVGVADRACPDNPTDEQIQQIDNCQIKDFADSDPSLGSSTGNTLFGMYNVVANQGGEFYDFIYFGLPILERAGVPGWITEGIIGNITSVLMVIAILSYARGYQL